MVSLRSSAEGAMRSVVSVILRSASVTVWFCAECLPGGTSQGGQTIERALPPRTKLSSARVTISDSDSTGVLQVAPGSPLPHVPRRPAQYSFGIISGHVSDCSKGSPLPTSAQPWPQGFSGESPTPWKSRKILVGRWRFYRDFISYKLK